VSLGDKLVKIRSLLKGARSIHRIKLTVMDEVGCKGKYLREFHCKIGASDWKGVIYVNHTSMMGTIFSLFNGKPLVVRGYPKIRHPEQLSMVLNREASIQAKYDGTNIGVFQLPNGAIMGKTRKMPRWDASSAEARKRGAKSWRELFYRTEVAKAVEKLVRDDYIAFGELYGYLNPGLFIQYNTPISYVVFDIVDMRTLKFLHFDRARKLAESYSVPFVEEMYRLNLSYKQIARLRFEAKKYFGKLDGYEGFVAKIFDTEANDMIFTKIVPEERNEIMMNTKGIISSKIIDGAIRKALSRDPTLDDVDSIYYATVLELSEEFSSTVIERHREKIVRAIKRKLSPSFKSLVAGVRESLNELGDRALNKSIAMPYLASRFPAVSAGLLYKAYLIALKEDSGAGAVK